MLSFKLGDQTRGRPKTNEAMSQMLRDQKDLNKGDEVIFNDVGCYGTAKSICNN